MIRELNDRETEAVYHAFIEAYFPRDEVKPLSHILRMREEGYYKVIAEFADGGPEESGDIQGCALLVTAPACGFYLLDYLAVHDRVRSRGIGAKLLSAVTSDYTNGKPVLIETESPESARTEEETAQRLRRNAFYDRNGAVQTGLTTVIFGVEYNIRMLVPDGRDPAESHEVKKELERIYHYMLPDELYGKYVRI